MSIFDVIALLFTKQPLTPGQRPPSWLVLGRFLASELAFAPLAKGIALEVQDDEVAWEIWRRALPKWQRPPRLNYIAPKKEVDDGLVQELASRFALNADEATEALAVIEAGGRTGDLRAFLGYQDQAKENRG